MTTTDLATLEAHAAAVVPPDGLERKLRQGRPLTVKLGFDPTAPDLHLGHAVVLRKLRDFQSAGHMIVIIIGDFTARIGDPTGRNRARPPLNDAEIAANSLTYVRQLAKVLDIERVRIRRNSEWLQPMSFADAVGMMAKVTLAQLLTRDEFRKRHEAQLPISMHELLYPLMQAHDSVAIGADVELGGTDQLFNCMMGRTLQEAVGAEPQVVVSMPLLVGTDGDEKMSKSKGNYIGLTDAPEDMYGKCMSVPDKLLPNYIDLACDLCAADAERLKSGLAGGTVHPMEVKKAVAHSIVTMYHGSGAANDAANHFVRNVQNRSAEDKTFTVVDLTHSLPGRSSIGIVDLCGLLESQLSKSEIRRLIGQGGVSVESERVSTASLTVPCRGGDLRLRIGKRGRFLVKRPPS
jgi:tyrosyl-tRNA synthetase